MSFQNWSSLIVWISRKKGSRRCQQLWCWSQVQQRRVNVLFFGKYSAVEASAFAPTHAWQAWPTVLVGFSASKNSVWTSSYSGWHCFASEMREGIHSAQGFKRLINATGQAFWRNYESGLSLYVYCDSSPWEKQFKCLRTCQFSCYKTHRRNWERNQQRLWYWAC